MNDQILVRWKNIKNKYSEIAIKAKESLLLWRAKAWQRVYRIKNWFFSAKSKHGARLGLLFLAAFIATSAVFVPALQGYFEPYISEQGRLD